MTESKNLPPSKRREVFALVEAGPRYSQDIVQALNESGFSGVTAGTLFPLLLRLEKEGLFIMKMEPSAVGPARKYYTLSAEGQRQLMSFQEVWSDFQASVDFILKG